MTFRGHVENGAIVLDDTATLPEGAHVVIEVKSIQDLDMLHPEVVRISGLISAPEYSEKVHLLAHAAKHS